MRKNKLRVYVHFVWATLDNQPLITNDIKERLYQSITQASGKQQCWSFAVNGMADHVHLCISLAPTVSIAEFIEQVKTTSEQFANEHLMKPPQQFKWQDTYGAYGVSRRNLDHVLAYIAHQDEAHQGNQHIPAFEETFMEETPDEDEE